MTETEDYAGETDDYAIPAGETPFTGEDITGEEGALVMDIPSARYPEGKTATAKDADLTAGNIKSGVDIFGKLGTHAPLVGDDVEGAEGALEIAIPAANYPAGKTATAKDAGLTAANIKKDVIIFGVTGSLTATITGREMVFGPKVAGDDCFLAGASFYSAGAYLSIGNRSGYDRHSSIRMPDCSIVPGSTITEAFLRMATEYPGAQATCNLKIHFNNVDNAVAPTNTAEFSALSLDAGVAWDAVEGWVTGVFYDTPSIVAALQAIIDRPSWASGNAIQAVIKNNGSSYDARRTPASVEWAYGQKRVELHAKWTEP